VPSATGQRVSRIVPTLDPGGVVTVPRTYIDYVVTEQGIAELRGKNESWSGCHVAAARDQHHPNFPRRAHQRRTLAVRGVDLQGPAETSAQRREDQEQAGAHKPSPTIADRRPRPARKSRPPTRSRMSAGVTSRDCPAVRRAAGSHRMRASARSANDRRSTEVERSGRAPRCGRSLGRRHLVS
jgi:hypothetical protein